MSSAELAVLAIALLGVLMGAYLAQIGIRQGIIARRIEIHDTGRYLTGRAALLRGVVYLVLGGCFLAGSSAAIYGFIARSLGFTPW